MRSFIALFALACLCEARPSFKLHPGISPAFNAIPSKIVGGADAVEGVWKWQLSQTVNGGHSCGATLLDANRGLSAAHCVDGQNAFNLAVIAGLYQRSNTAGTQQSGLSGYTKHENYNDGSGTYANDVAILQLATAITASGNVGYGTLPPDNNNQFVGTTCTLTGWGRTDPTNNLPDTLQQVDIEAISTVECQGRMGGSATITDGHICFYDAGNNEGCCNGDSGGPANCPNGAGGHYVAGVTSFVMQNVAGTCLQTYPSGYTRTSYYLDWINTH